jgi:hypothetical protein
MDIVTIQPSNGIKPSNGIQPSNGIKLSNGIQPSNGIKPSNTANSSFLKQFINIHFYFNVLGYSGLIIYSIGIILFLINKYIKTYNDNDQEIKEKKIAHNVTYTGVGLLGGAIVLYIYKYLKKNK